MIGWDIAILYLLSNPVYPLENLGLYAVVISRIQLILDVLIPTKLLCPGDIMLVITM
jgi:hypothetical protein